MLLLHVNSILCPSKRTMYLVNILHLTCFLNFLIHRPIECYLLKGVESCRTIPSKTHWEINFRIIKKKNIKSCQSRIDTSWAWLKFLTYISKLFQSRLKLCSVWLDSLNTKEGVSTIKERKRELSNLHPTRIVNLVYIRIKYSQKISKLWSGQDFALKPL